MSAPPYEGLQEATLAGALVGLIWLRIGAGAVLGRGYHRRARHRSGGRRAAR